MRSALKQFLAGVSDIGVLGSPPPYKRPTNTPFSDDRRKMRKDSRRIELVLAKNAREYRYGEKAIGRPAGF